MLLAHHRGDRALLVLERHALHAASLTLDHPLDGRRLRFTAPWPADLAKVLEFNPSA